MMLDFSAFKIVGLVVVWRLALIVRCVMPPLDSARV